MSFIAPVFLLGALAVSLPVLFHLIRRTTRERKIFSSLMFLLPSPPRLTRRSRLEHILLLVLRCIVVCLLAVGFARPFLRRAFPPAEPAAARRTLILVDSSASMRRANLWSDARTRAESVMRQASLADQVAVFTFDRELKEVVGFDQWTATAPGERASLAAGKLSALSPGWSDTHLGSALIQAAEAVSDAGGKPSTARARIVLISDLQQGSHLEPLQGYEWPRGIELSVESLKPVRGGNAFLQILPESDDAGVKAATTVRVRVGNTADSKREQFQVGWAGTDGRSFDGKSMSVYVPPGQSRIVAVPLPDGAAPKNRLRLQGDDEEFDNSVFVAGRETEQVEVLYIGNDAENDAKQALFFLKRAFQETRRRAVHVVPRTPAASIPGADLRAAALIVVAAPVPDTVTRALRDQVSAGKALLFLLESESAAATLARVLGIDQLKAEEIRPDNYALLAEIDFRHPILAPFADARFSDFTKIHFWKYRRLTPDAIPGARVLAKFDSGDPAILETPQGKGRVLVLTSGWQPEESQLGLSTKFVPLLYSILEQSGATAPMPPQFYVGDSVPVAAFAGGGEAPLVVQGPDGSESRLAAGETNFTQTVIPGVYTVMSEPRKQFAVNLNPAESQTMPLPVDQLEQLGAPVARQGPQAVEAARRSARLKDAELENRQKLWRWLLVGALAILGVETWLAGTTVRRPTLTAGNVT